MKWEKVGLIYEPKKKNKFILTHSANPLAEHLKDDIFRIYYNGRDNLNRSSVSFFDFNLSNLEVVQDFDGSIFNYEENTFYSDGISIGNIWKINNKKYMNFMGWQNPPDQHWFGRIGFIEIVENKLINPKILLDLSPENNISLSYPSIIFEDGTYKMWYGSTVDWQSINNEMIHVIKYATSSDSKNWDHKGLAVPYKVGIQQAFSRPTVIKIENVYHMWYSYRSGDGTPYRIGYCKSFNGLDWKSHDSGIECSDSGWDSEMICYPFVFLYKNYLYLLYNGNGFGKSGIGLAKIELKNIKN